MPVLSDHQLLFSCIPCPWGSPWAGLSNGGTCLATAVLVGWQLIILCVQKRSSCSTASKCAEFLWVPPLPDSLRGLLHDLLLISLEFLFLQIRQAFLCISDLGLLETWCYLQTVATGPLMLLVWWLISGYFLWEDRARCWKPKGVHALEPPNVLSSWILLYVWIGVGCP